MRTDDARFLQIGMKGMSGQRRNRYKHGKVLTGVLAKPNKNRIMCIKFPREECSLCAFSKVWMEIRWMRIWIWTWRNLGELVSAVDPKWAVQFEDGESAPARLILMEDLARTTLG